MAFFFGDSFDLYAQMVDATAGYWDAVSLNPNSSTFSPGRFSGSRAVVWSNSTTLVKASGQNDAVHHFVVAFQQTAALSGTNAGFYMELFDGTTAQCTVVFRSDGAITFMAGGPTGSLLALYTGAVTAINTWYAFEIEVVINNTTGSIAVRKNGNPNNDFFLGSLDTSATANPYANKLQLGSQSVSSGQATDDFLWRSDATAVPWVGDIRCYTRTPASDVAVQFSRSTASSNQLVFAPINVSNAFAADNSRYVLFTASYNGLVTGVIINCNRSDGGGAGHLKAALFTNSSNTIGTLLATSNAVTDPQPNSMVLLTFPTPARLVAGQTYWIGINQDASITYNVINASSVPVTCIALTQTYASWPVSNPGGTISNPNIYSPTIVFSPGANADTVSELQQDAGASYVYSSTNGQADLYDISSTASVPASVVGVTTRGFFTKTDVGTRNATVQLKSGATTVQGTSTALNSNVWGWIARNDLVDPATGAAWVPTAVNGVNIGPVVTA